tara:strand:+ start:5951 stop:6895 length:945 start_codon:yes stop_codon:yes gene_type:complete
MKFKNITLIAGGVGGAKLAEGFDAINEINLSVIGNIADDDTFHGLWVSPDIDTLTYSLAKIINRDQGWGLRNETFNSLTMLSKLNQETWMTLGDKDFGLHIYRTMRRQKGDSPSEIANDISKFFGLKTKIILPTNDIIKTKLLTENGWLNFQQYFVREKCVPKISKIKFDGIEKAVPTKESISSLKNADLIVLAPSNPLVSLGPIIDIPLIRETIINAKAPRVAVSPFIGNKTVKGPANKMMEELGENPNAVGFAQRFSDIIDLLFIDKSDNHLDKEIKSIIKKTFFTNILMKDQNDKLNLSKKILEVSQEIIK